jgi:DNA invertase Pin-like site-specific DNA recombinase
MDLPDAEIVRRYKEGESLQSLARSYGVSLPTIKRRIREDASRASA